MKTCEVPGCHQPHIARGLCSTHYARWRRGVPVEEPPVRDYEGKGSQQWCKEEGCTRRARNHHQCNAHSMRTRLGLTITGPVRAYRKKDAAKEEVQQSNE
jgi:hypothetical protein